MPVFVISYSREVSLCYPTFHLAISQNFLLGAIAYKNEGFKFVFQGLQYRALTLALM
jgi:hypothetical protein